MVATLYIKKMLFFVSSYQLELFRLVCKLPKLQETSTTSGIGNEPTNFVVCMGAYKKKFFLVITSTRSSI